MRTATSGKAESSAEASVMIASPNPEFRERIHEEVGSSFGTVIEAHGGAEALARLEDSPCRCLVLDRRLADLNAEEFERMLRDLYPEMEIIPLDSEGGQGEPTEAAQAAASLVATAAVAEPEAPAVETGQAEPCGDPLPGMIGASRAMGKVYRLARLVARRNTTVLVMGKTGTGKELVARALHDLSPRAHGTFVTVNCAAIPEALLEAELFGHARGAFTGAVQSRLGRIHAAHGGTLFLDEAGELPLSMQAKLLRFLQHGEVQRLGSTDVFRVDVRVVAATNADLAERVERGTFRADLYYRLSVFPIELPLLRDRVEDVVPLAMHHVEQLCRESGIPMKKLTPAARALLERHAWPGNVRELQHAIERAFILSEEREEISAAMFHLAAPRALP